MPRKNRKPQPELFEDSAAGQRLMPRVLLPIGRRALLDVLCGGVLPSRMKQGGEPVERPQLPIERRFASGDSQRWYFVEVGAEAWSVALRRGGLPSVEISAIQLPDDLAKQDLFARIRSVEGMPRTLPRLEVVAERFSADGVPFDGFEEIDPRPMHGLSPGRVAAASLVLFASLRDVANREVLDSALDAISTTGISEDGVVAALSRIANCSETVGKCLLGWACSSGRDGDDPMVRLEHLVSELTATREMERKLLVALRDHVQSVVHGTRAVDEGRLRDDRQILLRAVAGLFRCSRMDGPTVDAFLEHQRAGTVGVRVALAMRLLATWGEGGFASMIGTWKSDDDLYRVGSFLAASQTDRVCVERLSGGGWRVISDGQPVPSLSLSGLAPVIVDPGPEFASPVLTLLKGWLAECGYSPSVGVSSNEGECLGASPLRVIIAADSRIVAFTASIALAKRGKKSRQPRFFEALGQSVLRCEVRYPNFPVVELRRDQVWRDISRDGVIDHVEAVRAAVSRVEQVWNEQVPVTKRSKSRGNAGAAGP